MTENNSTLNVTVAVEIKTENTDGATASMILEATDIIEEEAVEQPKFDEDLIKKYPRSNRKVQIGVARYGLFSELEEVKSQSLHISPHGLEFQVPKTFEDGALLKINIALPDYWNRKRRFVDYARIDSPDTFKVLAKVVRSEDIGKRGKKKLVIAQVVNMDEIDEQVLKSFLQDG